MHALSSKGRVDTITTGATPPSEGNTSCFLYDTNVPGLPYRSPTPNPTNLELAWVREYLYLKNRTMQHISDMWRVIETGQKNWTKLDRQRRVRKSRLFCQAFCRAMQRVQELQFGAGQNENHHEPQNHMARWSHPMYEILSSDAMQNMHGRPNRNPQKTSDWQAKNHQQ